MHYRPFMLILACAFSSLAAHVDTPRTFHNDADKKIRVTLWYKRYKHVKNGIRYENRMRKYTTYIKPGRSATITLRATMFEDLEFCYLMATNTRRRNEWTALTYKDLQKNNDYTIVYDDNNSLTITSSSRKLS